MSDTPAPSARQVIGEAYVARLHEFPSITAAAREALEHHPELRNVENARKAICEARLRVMKRARVAPAAPVALDDYKAPQGFAVKGRSTYFDKEGQRGGQWVIEREDAQRQREIFEEGLAACAEDLPRLAPLPAPEHVEAALCNQYNLTDVHLGVMVSAGEGGESWGLDKGERLIGDGFDRMIAGAPRARRAVIAQLGDFMHSEGLASVTSRSGHSLDQDARFGDLVRASFRLMRRVIDSALSTHEVVDLVIAEGNHDEAASAILRTAMAAIYEHEPRLNVVECDLPYYETTHGEVMLGFHHGHIKHVSRQAKDLALIFANGDAWRTTRKRFIYCGHHHNEAVVEVTGAKLHALPAFIPPDAYASRNFGGAMRELTAITYHERHGKVGSNTVTPEMLDS